MPGDVGGIPEGESSQRKRGGWMVQGALRGGLEREDSFRDASKHIKNRILYIVSLRFFFLSLI